MTAAIIVRGSVVLSILASGALDAQIPRYPAQTYAFGGVVTAATIGDFDEDGVVDAIVTVKGMPAPRLLRGDGFGAFEEPVALSVAASGFLASGDVDADGHLDVIHADELKIRILFGDGSGSTFVAGQAMAFGKVIALKAADFDGDGHCDAAAVTNPIAAGIVTLFGQSATAFAVGPFVGSLPISLRDATDLNGDGRADLITMAPNGPNAAFTVYRGNSNRTFTQTWTNPMPLPGSGSTLAFACGSVNGDAFVDFVCSALPGTYVMLGDASGGYTPSLISTSLRALCAADMNLDGFVDLVDDSFRVWPGQGDGTFGAPQGVGLTGPTSVLGAVHCDGDSVPDLVSWNESSLGILRGDATKLVDGPELLLGAQSPTGNFVHGAVELVDGDANADLLFVRDGALHFMKGDGAGGFGPIIGLGPALDRILCVDITGDGALDAVTWNSTGVGLRQGDGAGGFSPIALTSSAPGLQDLTVLDADSDGDLDLAGVLGSFPNNGPVWAKNLGSGLFGPSMLPLPVSAPPQARRLASGDVDADGDDDLLIDDTLESHLMTLYTQQSGNFAATATFTSAHAFVLDIALADVDADADLDVVAIGTTETKTSLNLGGASFAPQVVTSNYVTTPEGFPPYVVPAQFVDMDSDGHVDIVVASAMPHGVAVLRGDGAGGFADVRRLHSPFEMTGAQVADLDHDGRMDVVAFRRFSTNPGLVNAAFATLHRETCHGGVATFGLGCAGTGGFTPRVALDGCPTPGGSVSFSVKDALGGAPALLMFGTAASPIPLPGSGCTLLAAPLLPATVSLPLSGTGPGHGTIVVPASIPVGAPTGTIAMQVLCADPGAAGGVSGTQGLRVVIK